MIPSHYHRRHYPAGCLVYTYIHISFSCIDVVSSRFCSTQACLCRAARCCTLASGCPERGIAEGPRAAAWWNRSTTRRTWTSLTLWTTHSTPSNSIQTCSIDSCRNTMSRTILKRCLSAARGGICFHFSILQSLLISQDGAIFCDLGSGMGPIYYYSFLTVWSILSFLLEYFCFWMTRSGRLIFCCR